MKRLSKYAADHNGIILDPFREIRTQAGWTVNYSDYVYKNDAKVQANAIDLLLNYLSRNARYSYVAIIGDDEVIPSQASP